MNEDVIFALIPIVALLIPLVALLRKPFGRWLDLKERSLALQSQSATDQSTANAAKIERLEAHVAVLNRIATDRSGHLADEIDSLRKPAALN